MNLAILLQNQGKPAEALWLTSLMNRLMALKNWLMALMN